MTEEELAALIDQAVAEAYAAAETAYTTTTTSTADDTVTTQESQSMTYTVQLSEQQVEEAGIYMAKNRDVFAKAFKSQPDALSELLNPAAE